MKDTLCINTLETALLKTKFQEIVFIACERYFRVRNALYFHGDSKL